MRWKDYLETVTGRDKKAVDALQEFCGYCLQGSNSYARLLGLAGPVAETFVFIKVLVALVGAPRAIHFGRCFLDDPVCRNRLLNRRLAYMTDFHAAARSVWFRKLLHGIPVSGGGDDSGFSVPGCKFVLVAEKPVHLESLPPEVFRHTLMVQFYRRSRPLDMYLVGQILQEMDEIRHWAVDGLERLIARGGFQDTDHHVQHSGPEKQINKIVPENFLQAR